MPGFGSLACPSFVSMQDGIEEESPYEEVAVIGNGAYGTVYKARNLKKDDEFVAIKKIRIQTSQDDGMPMSTIREIAMLKQLENFDHPHVVRLLDVCYGRRVNNEMNLMLVFEHVDQDLSHYLEKCPSPGLGPERIKELMKQILNGIDFLHTNRIVHRDLKPQNVLVTHDGRVKLADFGLARVYGFQMALTAVVVTLWYRAPEVLLQAQYATAVDMWSCGCIFAELHTRKPLFAGQSDIDQLRKIFDITGLAAREDWPENVSLPWSSFQPSPKVPYERIIPEIEDKAKDLLEKFLVFKQGNRISAHDALLHPYFTGDDSGNESSMFESHDTSASSLTSDNSLTEETDQSPCSETLSD